MELTKLSDADFLDKILDENVKVIKEVKNRTAHAGSIVLLAFTFDQVGRLNHNDNNSSNNVTVSFKTDREMNIIGINSIHFNSQSVNSSNNNNSAELLGNEYTVFNSLVAYASVKPDDIKGIDIKVGEASLSDDQKNRLVPKLLSV